MQLSFRVCLALASFVLAASTIDVPAASAARSPQMAHRRIMVRPEAQPYGDIRAHLPFVNPMPTQREKDPFADLLHG